MNELDTLKEINQRLAEEVHQLKVKVIQLEAKLEHEIKHPRVIHRTKVEYRERETCTWQY